MAYISSSNLSTSPSPGQYLPLLIKNDSYQLLSDIEISCSARVNLIRQHVAFS